MKVSCIFHIYLGFLSGLLCPQLANAHYLRDYVAQRKNATQPSTRSANLLMTEAPKYHLIDADHKCTSTESFLGVKLTVQECATAVEANGGKLFSFGKAGSDKAGSCKSVSCAEWFESEMYNFYSLESPGAADLLSGPIIAEADKREKYPIIAFVHHRLELIFGKVHDDWYMDWKLWVGLVCWFSVLGKWVWAGYGEVYVHRFIHCFGINIFILHWLQYASSVRLGMLAINGILIVQCLHLNFLVSKSDYLDALEGDTKEKGEIDRFTCDTMYLDLSLPMEQIMVLFISQTIVWWFYMTSIIANFDLSTVNYTFWFVAFLTMQMTMIFNRGEDSVLGAPFPVHDVHRLIVNADDVQFDLEETEDDPPFQLTKANIVFRGLSGFLCNTILREIMSYTIPLMLMGFSEPMDFVVYCVGVNFICTLDDMKEKHFNMTLVPWSSRNIGGTADTPAES